MAIRLSSSGKSSAGVVSDRFMAVLWPEFRRQVGPTLPRPMFAYPSILIVGPAAQLHVLAIEIRGAIVRFAASNGVSVDVNLAAEPGSGRDADEPHLVWVGAWFDLMNSSLFQAGPSGSEFCKQGRRLGTGSVVLILRNRDGGQQGNDGDGDHQFYQ